MEPVTVTQVESALMRAVAQASGRSGWQAWRDLVDAVRRGVYRGAVQQALEAAEEAPVDVVRIRALAVVLVDEARLRPELSRELRRWVLDSAGPGHSGREHINAISGAAQVMGPAVQARDVQGGIHFHPAPAFQRPVPRQLPPVPAHFTNRERELVALSTSRECHTHEFPLLAVITGPAGVGKTALASRWLHQLARDFPDGQLYADLHGHASLGPAKVGEILGQFLRAFGVGEVPAELTEQVALWRSVTADLRIAMLLDNAPTAAQVRPLLPSAGGSLVTVTSRRRLTGLGVDGAHFHQLAVLDARASVELLTRGGGGERVTREPDAAQEVVSLCGGLPLAVCVAAARLASRPRQSMAAMASALSVRGKRLATLHVEGEPAVQTALDESYRSLSADTARGYRRLGLPPVVIFNSALAAAACALPLPEADRLLDELVEVNLIEDLSPDRTTGLDRYRFHDLVRLHAGERAVQEELPSARRAIVRRVLEWYLATTTTAEEMLSPSHRSLRRDYAFPSGPAAPFTDANGALDWLDTERLQLMAAVRTAAQEGWNAIAWQLVDAMWPLFLRLRPYDLWIEAHEIGLAAARRAGHRDGESRMLTSGGTGLRNAGRLDEAVTWFAQALDGARQDQNRMDEAQALHGLGQSHRLAGRLDLAAPLFVQALQLREAIGYRRGAALSRLCLGDVALAAGRLDEATTHLSQARIGLVAESDPYDAARALAFLGRAHAALREYGTAGRHLRCALDEFRTTGSIHWQARVLEMLGQTAEEHNDAPAARHAYQESLALYTPVSASDARRLAERLHHLGIAADPERGRGNRSTPG